MVEILAVTRSATGSILNVRNITGASSNTNTCGICGQPLDRDHSHEEENLGTPIEYKVVKIRGVLADSVSVNDPNDKHPLPAQALARNLGVDASSLLGLH